MKININVIQFSVAILSLCCSVFRRSSDFSMGLVGHYQAENGGYFDIDLLDDKGKVGFRIEDFTQGGQVDSNDTAQCVTFFEMQIIVPHDLTLGNSVVCNFGKATVVGFLADFRGGNGDVNEIYQIQVESKYDLRLSASTEDAPKYQLYYSTSVGLLGLSYSRWGKFIFYKRKSE